MITPRVNLRIPHKLQQLLVIPSLTIKPTKTYHFGVHVLGLHTRVLERLLTTDRRSAAYKRSKNLLHT